MATGSGMNLELCLEAIAVGDGREVMQFDEARRLIMAYAVVCFCSAGVRWMRGRADCQRGGRLLYGAHGWGHVGPIRHHALAHAWWGRVLAAPAAAPLLQTRAALPLSRATGVLCSP